MKKALIALTLVLAIICCAAVACTAEETLAPRPENRPRIIMYAILKEKPGSETFSVCCIDEEGDIWTARNVPAEQEGDILQMLRERRDM